MPADAPSYVKRQADDEFYTRLKASQFCYVLNSRQMGKSSLRVRVMQRLEADGIICAFIDLTGIGREDVTPEKWYAGIVQSLVSSSPLSGKFKWRPWWREHRDLLSPVQRLSKFISEVLLVEVPQNVVIFVDEIDSVISQSFSLDDFFALIRFFYNQRVDRPEYRRLAFALLGVATPSDLIADKTLTPFNIGHAIALNGFEPEEVEPLTGGLVDIASNPRAVIAEILNWSGGQPFLTQKICHLIVSSCREAPEALDGVSRVARITAGGEAAWVERVVRSEVIENWESRDEPEHLRTIRDRLLANEQRAGRLLILYQQILQNSHLPANNSLEQTQLRLSGIAVKRNSRLQPSNRIYQEVFNFDWVEKTLASLRPYSESFKAWAATGGRDKSRLLRGRALEEARDWANGKSLSDLDYQFLAASQQLALDEERAALEARQVEAELDRERKAKEAAERAKQILSEAYQKAQRRIRMGFAGLVAIGFLATAIVGWAGVSLREVEQKVKTVSQLSQLGGELSNAGQLQEAEEAWKQAGLSLEIKDPRLKQAMLLSNISRAYQQLERWEEAEKALEDCFNLLGKQVDMNASVEELQIRTHALDSQGRFFRHRKDYRQPALAAYTEAFQILQALSSKATLDANVQIISRNVLNCIHRQLINLLLQPDRPGQENLSKAREVIESLQFVELNNFSQFAHPDVNLENIDRTIERVSPKTAIIYPIILPDRLGVILKLPRQQKLYHHSTLVSHLEVSNTLSKLYHYLRYRPGWRDETKKVSKEVYDWLVKPIEADLANSSVDTLVFVSDGLLQNVPMAVLHDGDSYLIEKYAIAANPGLQLLDAKPWLPKRLNALVAGTWVEQKGFRALPFVEVELEQISSLMPSQSLYNKDVTPSNLQNALSSSSFSVVHFAGHANASSSLNDEGSFIMAWNERIDANDLSELLRPENQGGSKPIELLVLSACETAAGEEYAGLGMAGAAVRSGVRSVVAPKWPVNDESTAEFMAKFYKELRKPNVTKAEALRRAQLYWIENETNLEWRNPHYWAPFVLVGNWL